MSFRTRKEFMEMVRGNLTSNLWNTIKDSLLGSELIAYAAEFLYLQEVQSDEIVSSVFPSENSSLLNILMNGNFNNTPFSYFRPASITVTIADSDGRIRDTRGTDVTESFPTYLEPFTLSLTKGNVVYTNISWVARDGKITLYQGTPRVLSVNGGTPSDGRFYPQVKQSSQNDTDIFRTFGSADYFSYYVQLESLPYVPSVYVYSHKNQRGWKWNTYQVYDSINAGVDAMNYKLFWGNDLKLQLHFGDGLWGRGFMSDEVYFVYYLDCTFNQIDLSGLTLSYTDRELDNSIQGISFNAIGTQDYSVSMSVSFQNLRNALAKNSVVSTKKQVESFVMSYPLVKDCSVVPSETVGNTVNIYVRPNVVAPDTEESFDITYLTDITEALQTYGDLVTRYTMNKARKLELSVAVTILEDVDDFENLSQEIRNYIVNLVDNSSIGQSVNFSELSNEIYRNFGVRNIVRYYVQREEVSDDMLSFIPVLNTIKSVYHEYPTTGSDSVQITSWDGIIENGVLWGINRAFEKAEAGEGIQPVNPIAIAYQMGDFTLVTFDTSGDTRNIYVFHGNKCKFVERNSTFLFPFGNDGDFNFSFECPTEQYVSVCKFNANGTVSFYNVNNYGYYSNDSTNNYFSPNPGAIDTTLGSSDADNFSYFKKGFIPSMVSYRNAYFIVVSLVTDSYSLQRKSATAGITDVSVALPDFNPRMFRGYYVTDSSVYLLTNTANIVYSLPHNSDSLGVSNRLVLLDENSSVLPLTMTVGLFQGWTFGLDNCAYISSMVNGSYASLQNDGRIGVNVIDSHITDTGNITLYSEGHYTILCFTSLSAGYGNIYLSKSSSDLTEKIKICEVSYTVNTPIYVLINTDTLGQYSCLSIASGTYYRTFNVVPQTPTHYINICSSPDTSSPDMLTIRRKASYKFIGGAEIGSGYSATDYFDTFECLSLHNLHYACDGDDNDHFLYADVLMFEKNEQYSVEFSNVSYTRRMLIHCYNNGTENIAEFVPEYEELSKVGNFTQDGRLNKVAGAEIQRLNVSYEAQNSFFEVDEKSYIELDSDNIHVQKIQ